MLLGHRQAFAWIDEWIEMSYDDVRNYEAKLQKETNNLIGRGDNPPEGEKKISESNTPMQTPEASPTATKKGYFSWFS